MIFQERKFFCADNFLVSGSRNFFSSTVARRTDGLVQRGGCYIIISFSFRMFRLSFFGGATTMKFSRRNEMMKKRRRKENFRLGSWKLCASLILLRFWMKSLTIQNDLFQLYNTFHFNTQFQHRREFIILFWLSLFALFREFTTIVIHTKKILITETLFQRASCSAFNGHFS